MRTVKCFYCGKEITREFIRSHPTCFACKLKKNRERTLKYNYAKTRLNRDDAGTAGGTQAEAGR